MNVTDFISRFLHAQGVTHVFELSGGMITQIIDSLYQEGNISIVSVKHEQAAGFAAEGFAREKNVPGVALATSGPGATNLLTAIGSCEFDAVHDVIMSSFLKPSIKEVNYLAASRIAIDLLGDAWKELGRYAKKDEVVVNKPQVGL